MPAYTMQSNATVLSVDISGDLAVMISANELQGMPRPGAPGTKSGRDGNSPPAFTERRTNLTVFKKQSDGRWLIHRFIDTTPPEPVPNTVPAR
jgi:ketosteroid isomerase-like protein